MICYFDNQKNNKTGLLHKHTSGIKRQNIFRKKKKKSLRSIKKSLIYDHIIKFRHLKSK